jgi:predicted permease
MSLLPPALQLALRRLARSPLLTALVILTLAPGIGAHVAIFSFVNALFIRPLPLVESPDRVVGVYETRDGGGFSPMAFPDYVDYRDSTRSFSALAAHYPTAPLILSGGDESVEINGSVVTASYFPLLGVKPALGRFFLPGEDAAPGAGPVAVVSFKLWRSRFAGRKDVLGKILRLNDTGFTVIGVAPEGFEGVLLGIPSDVWVPSSMARSAYRSCDPLSRDCTWVTLIGRLKAGRTIKDAQTEMDLLSARLRSSYPDTNKGRGVRIVPLRGVHPAAREETLHLAGLLLSGVTLVVVIACANATGLLLMRGLTRRKEIAVRLALGATRRGVVSPFVAEALVQALLGGAAGLLLASWFGRVVVALYPSDVPLDLRADLSVIGYTLLLSLLIGLVVGLVPGLQATRPSVVTGLKEEVAVAAKGRPRLLGLLIVVQVALSFVLLTCTGLLARSVILAGHGGGFDPDGVVTLRLRPRLIAYKPPQGQAFSREALRRIAGLPGVRSVCLAVVFPPWHPGDTVAVGHPGQKPDPDRPKGAPSAWAGDVGPGFFRTLGVPILRGRDFDGHDTPGAPPVAIVNQTLARRLWPGGDPLGQPLAVDGKTYQIIGLVPDVGYQNFRAPAAAQVYRPYWQQAELTDARLAVRVAGDPAQVLPALRRELHAIDPAVPVTEVELMTHRLDQFLAPVRVAGYVLGLSAGLALFLSAVGLYGILSLLVAQRRRDIGIRMALGARRSQVVSLVVRDAAILVMAALVLGLMTALGASGLLAHYLYGVTPRDPVTFAAALLLLTLTAALASWLPARRASRVDPLVAIRQT